MRIEFGYGKAICLREEDFTEIVLSDDKFTYSRPNGQKITVLLSSAWISEPKAALSQKPSHLDLNSGANLQESSYGASSSSTAFEKGSTTYSESHLDSGRASVESNLRFDELLAKEWDLRLGRLKDDLIQTRAEHHKELEAFRAQLLETKTNSLALNDTKDLVKEVQIKLEAKFQGFNDYYAKEFEQLKARLAHIEADYGTNQLKFKDLHLERLKEDIVQIRAEHHKELEAFRTQLLEIKKNSLALNDPKDWIKELQTKLEAQIQGSNEDFVKEYEQLKTRLAHLEEDSGTYQLKLNKLFEQAPLNESKSSKEKHDKSDWQEVNVQAIHDYLKWEEEEDRRRHERLDFEDQDYYDDYDPYANSYVNSNQQKNFCPNKHQKKKGKYGKG